MTRWPVRGFGGSRGGDEVAVRLAPAELKTSCLQGGEPGQRVQNPHKRLKATMCKVSFERGLFFTSSLSSSLLALLINRLSNTRFFHDYHGYVMFLALAYRSP